jgi:protein SCO1/2
MSEPETKDTPPPARAPWLAALGLTRRVAWIAILLVAVPGALLYGGKQFGWFGPPASKTAPPRPAVGGPFDLVDHEGRAATDADFRGRLMIVFFGFTYCPDVCPTALTAIAQALDLLGADAVNVAPLFITVDPERDTPEQLKEYVRHFHPRLIGLTGTPEKIAAAAKAYRVYYAKARAANAPPDEYTMDHTSIVYLMGRDGKFLAHFSHGTEPKAIADRARSHL